MINENIISTLRQIFNEPLRNGEKRKIVFWNDYDKEFEDCIDEINIEGVRVHRLTERNNFYTKYLLEEEDTESNFLIYNTARINDERDNWLLDIILYSKEFYADNTSLIMQELNIDNSLRGYFCNYKQFFGAMDRRNKISKYSEVINTREKLELAILGALCSSKTIDIEEILKIVLMEALEESENRYYEAFKNYNINEAFWYYINLKYGFDDKNPTLKKLFLYVVSTALGSYIDEEKLSRVKGFIGKNKPNCVVFLDHWINHKTDFEKYDDLSEIYEEETNISEIIDGLDVEEYKEIELLKAFDRAIIRNIVEALQNRLEDYDNYIEIIKGRRTKHFYKDYSSIYEALINAIEMFRFYKKYKNGLPISSCDKLFKDYVNEYYNMDTYYRKFYYYYDLQPESNVINILKSLVENLYVNWYLSEVCTNFTLSISEDMKKEWTIPSIINQRDFYKTYINPMIESRDRVFVIISDALRYEVGAEIAQRLNEKVIKSTTIVPMLSTVPSITKLGMASLLPNKSIELKDNGKVLVDNMDSSGLENRNKILKYNFDNSIAVDYQKLPKNKIEFLEELKGYKLIYIYHDTIDATADKGATEIYTFEAVEKAIDEIMDMVHKITTWLGGSNVLITADHGFIYQRSNLEESDKISKGALEVIDRNRRCIISKDSVENEDLLKINLDYLLENKGIFAYMPKSNIRFKVQGEGSKFVHGGATLQEIVVPVVAFKNIRSTSKKSVKAKKVTVKLTNEVRKITNSIFTLNFFQTEKIDEKTTPISFDVYMVDKDNNIVSNIQTLIADSSDDRPEERVLKTKLTLKAIKYNKNEKYSLIMKDKETGMTIEEIPFTISLGIASDFDF